MGHEFDVAVIGAGPAGATVAGGFAKRGQRVLLLEQNPNAAKRFAGEWIHPPGLRVLDRLGLAPIDAATRHSACRGFVVFPDDGGEAIKLPYPDDAVGFSCEHGDFVNTLRDRVAEDPRVTYIPHARLNEVDGVTLRYTLKGKEHVTTATRVVGADGRSSTVRAQLGRDSNATVVSHMAGVELTDVALPHEGFGHVLLGGPGPVLLYRIGPDRLRACLDIPRNFPGSRRDATYLFDAFHAVFPEALRPAFRAALGRKIHWAVNRFSPRSFYGDGNAALVGDAVGFFHPLTAAGITMGLRDAEALLSARDVADYQRSREPKSYVPELLANALYQVFVRDDEGASELRRSVFRLWRNSPAERERTMRILAGDEVRLTQFGGAFVTVAMSALASMGTRDLKHGGLRRLGRDLGAFREWVQWPAAALLPRRLRNTARPTSDPLHPLKALGLRWAPSLPELKEKKMSAPNVDELIAALPTAEAILPPTDLPATDTSTLGRFVIGSLDASAPDLDEAIITLAERVENGPRSISPALRDACAALRRVSEVRPGLRADVITSALTAARDRVQVQQQPDGSFADPYTSALAVETLASCIGTTVHPSIRRAARWLAEAQNKNGSWPGATAEVVRALLTVGAPQWEAVERGVATLTKRDLRHRPAREALRLYRDLRPGRVASRRVKAVTGPSAADRAFCQRSLEAVSRTFARPIEMLPGDLRSAVTCGYLLCRVADTIEDNDNLTVAERDVRYAAFLEVIENDASADAFAGMWARVPGRPAELELCENLEAVMRVFRDLPKGMQSKTRVWVAEMTRGMQLYSHRRAGPDGIMALGTIEDLDRYCYYVAGTVGHMLTDLFVEEMGMVGSKTELDLREHAEAFGVGLQLVNILKDVTDDRERNVSFLPRATLARAGLAMTDIFEPAKRPVAHQAVAPLFEMAEARLARALRYTLAIPAEHQPIRLFCLLPLFMAVRTLVHARGNDAMFVEGQPVKISRKEVERLISECVSRVGEDAQLRERFDALWAAPPERPELQLVVN